MDREVQTILTKTAEYFEKTQPLIDAYNEQKVEFVKRATEVARNLVTAGVMDKREVDGFVDKVASSPTSVWDVVEKLATLVGTDVLGSVAREKVASEAVVPDPWAQRLFGEQSNSQTSGLVD